MKRSMVIAVIVGTLFGFTGQTLADMSSQSSETVERIHQVNRLVGRAMGMVTEGANLVLVASMNLAPPIDKSTAAQGMKMIQNGKDLVNVALAGEGMTAMEKKEMESNAMMETAESLGKSILKYIDIVENMKMNGTVENKVKLHQVHLRINNALNMAAEGANLVMLGDLKLAEVLDKYTVEHGRMMLRDARTALSGMPDSEAMKELKLAYQGSTDNHTMITTDELLNTALKIVDTLNKMAM